VAVPTAGSGYQAARWDARSARNYALALRYNVQAQEKATLAGLDSLYEHYYFRLVAQFQDGE
jgi:hypothetical protein